MSLYLETRFHDFDTVILITWLANLYQPGDEKWPKEQAQLSRLPKFPQPSPKKMERAVFP